MMSFRICLLVLLLTQTPALAQMPGGPPPVGTAVVQAKPIVESNEFVGRVQAVDRVDLVARITAFVDAIDFTEGSEVAKGDVLYRLERGPFEADVNAKTAALAQVTALLRNASITLGRANSLLNTPAGQRSTVDDATAQQASQAAQVAAAQSQLRASQINLAYATIIAPVAGKISRTALTVGNVVTPASGPLATIVSQDPMYVLFPVSSQTAVELANRYAGRPMADAVTIKLRLPDGSIYGQNGKLDYVDPTVATATDTQNFRAVIPNPLRAGAHPGDFGARTLVDGGFVTAIVQGAQPVQVLTFPRVAVLEDQQGPYVFVVAAGNTAELRRVTLAQSSPAMAAVTAGVKAGETVIVDGLQKVQPGGKVVPTPAAAEPAAPADVSAQVGG